MKEICLVTNARCYWEKLCGSDMSNDCEITTCVPFRYMYTQFSLLVPELFRSEIMSIREGKEPYKIDYSVIHLFRLKLDEAENHWERFAERNCAEYAEIFESPIDESCVALIVGESCRRNGKDERLPYRRIPNNKSFRRHSTTRLTSASRLSEVAR